MSSEFEIKQENLKKIFYPESLAIVGATKITGTVPNDIITNILRTNFQGVVFPVSPKERFINAVKCYKYIIDIEDQIAINKHNYTIVHQLDTDPVVVVQFQFEIIFG